MLTMCAWRMRRRLTMSVICMREPSSLGCACAAKMLTCALLHVGGDRRPAGRRSGRARDVLEHEQPVRRADGLDLARRAPRAMSRQARSVITVTRSCGCTFRQTRIALRAPGCKLGVEVSHIVHRSRPSLHDLSQSCLRLGHHVVDDRLEIVAGFLEHAAAGGRRRCRARGSCGCTRRPPGCRARRARRRRSRGIRGCSSRSGTSRLAGRSR